MKKLTIALIVLATLTLTGCITSVFNTKDKTLLEVTFRPTSNENPLVAIKNNVHIRQKCKEKDSFFTWGGTCHFGNNFKGHFSFEYAVMPINRSQVHQIPVNQRKSFELKHIQSLPPSAWRTYTIDTKPIMEEARKQYLNNALYQRDGMKVTLTLYVDENGDITQSVEYAALPGYTWTG